MTRKSFTSRKDPAVTERKIDYMREHLAEIAKNAEKARLTEVKEQEELDDEQQERVNTRMPSVLIWKSITREPTCTSSRN